MRNLLIPILVAGACVSTTRAGGPSYDPQWTIGDSWNVRFTVKLSTHPKVEGPPPDPVPTEFVYQYSVVEDTVENGRNVIRIRADLDEGGSDWLLTFDKDQIVLLRVEEIVEGDEDLKHHNPFTDDGWMSKLREYNLFVIHDFPKIPKSGVDETREVTPSQSGTPPFTQSVTFGQDQVTVNLTRTDPESSLEHKTTIVWDAGQKWWSSATVQLDANVEVSGVLEPARRGKSSK